MTMTTSELIAKIESGQCDHAMRFEPGFKPSQRAMENIKKAHAPAFMNFTTASTIAQISWGRFQIMGENIYTVCGYHGTIFDFINDSNAQEKAFNKFCAERGIVFSTEELKDSEDKRRLFARRYNGSYAYADKIKSVLEMD